MHQMLTKLQARPHPRDPSGLASIAPRRPRWRSRASSAACCRKNSSPARTTQLRRWLKDAAFPFEKALDDFDFRLPRAQSPGLPPLFSMSGS